MSEPFTMNACRRDIIATAAKSAAYESEDRIQELLGNKWHDSDLFELIESAVILGLKDLEVQREIMQQDEQEASE